MIEVFHGNNVQVPAPQILTKGFFKDFGYGFYCTNLLKQAKRWSMSRGPEHVVSIYRYNETNTLKKLVFPEMTEEWLEFVVNCRRGIPHSFDVVEGPMADDTIWNFIESYIAGEISHTAFWELVKFRYPTRQIVFCTEDSLKTITFDRSMRL